MPTSTIPALPNTWAHDTIPADACMEAGSASQPVGLGSAKIPMAAVPLLVTNFAASFAAVMAGGGGTITLQEDVEILAPLSFTMTAPMVVDLNGHTIEIATTTGPGITFEQAIANRNVQLVIKNGTIKQTTSDAITGLYFHYCLGLKMERLSIEEFDNAASVAVDWDDVEDSCMRAVQFHQNALALYLHAPTNQNEFSSVWFEQNVQALRIKNGAQLNRFTNCLFQSCSGAHAVELIAEAGFGVQAPVFDSCWFEDNGNGTSASRNIYVNSAATGAVAGLLCLRCMFGDTDSGGVGAGKCIEWTGAGNNANGVLLENNFANDPNGTLPSNYTVIGYGTGSFPTSLAAGPTTVTGQLIAQLLGGYVVDIFDTTGTSGACRLRMNAKNAAGVDKNVEINFRHDLGAGTDAGILIQGLGGTLASLCITALGIGVNKNYPKSAFAVGSLPNYADQSAALAGGLTAGDFYQTSGALKVVT